MAAMDRLQIGNSYWLLLAVVVVFFFLSDAATTTTAAAVNPPLPHPPSLGLSQQQQQQQQQQHHSTVYRHLPEITPGKPGRDYPLATSVPTTSFNCSTYNYPGQFADQETDCQVYRVCREGVMTSFICPNGTLFNQRFFVCDWWFNVDCGKSSVYYELNKQTKRKLDTDRLLEKPTTTQAPSSGQIEHETERAEESKASSTSIKSSFAPTFEEWSTKHLSPRPTGSKSLRRPNYSSSANNNNGLVNPEDYSEAPFWAASSSTTTARPWSSRTTTRSSRTRQPTTQEPSTTEYFSTTQSSSSSSSRSTAAQQSQKKVIRQRVSTTTTTTTEAPSAVAVENWYTGGDDEATIGGLVQSDDQDKPSIYQTQSQYYVEPQNPITYQPNLQSYVNQLSPTYQPSYADDAYYQSQYVNKQRKPTSTYQQQQQQQQSSYEEQQKLNNAYQSYVDTLTPATYQQQSYDEPSVTTYQQQPQEQSVYLDQPNPTAYQQSYGEQQQNLNAVYQNHQQQQTYVEQQNPSIYQQSYSNEQQLNPVSYQSTPATSAIRNNNGKTNINDILLALQVTPSPPVLTEQRGLEFQNKRQKAAAAAFISSPSPFATTEEWLYRQKLASAGFGNLNPTAGGVSLGKWEPQPFAQPFVPSQLLSVNRENDNQPIYDNFKPIPISNTRPFASLSPISPTIEPQLGYQSTRPYTSTGGQSVRPTFTPDYNYFEAPQKYNSQQQYYAENLRARDIDQQLVQKPVKYQQLASKPYTDPTQQPQSQYSVEPQKQFNSYQQQQSQVPQKTISSSFQTQAPQKSIYQTQSSSQYSAEPPKPTPYQPQSLYTSTATISQQKPATTNQQSSLIYGNTQSQLQSLYSTSATPQKQTNYQTYIEIPMPPNKPNKQQSTGQSYPDPAAYIRTIEPQPNQAAAYQQQQQQQPHNVPVAVVYGPTESSSSTRPVYQVLLTVASDYRVHLGKHERVSQPGRKSDQSIAASSEHLQTSASAINPTTATAVQNNATTTNYVESEPAAATVSKFKKFIEFTPLKWIITPPPVPTSEDSFTAEHRHTSTSSLQNSQPRMTSSSSSSVPRGEPILESPAEDRHSDSGDSMMTVASSSSSTVGTNVLMEKFTANSAAFRPSLLLSAANPFNRNKDQEGPQDDNKKRKSFFRSN